MSDLKRGDGPPGVVTGISIVGDKGFPEIAAFPVVPTDKERADAIRAKLQPLLEQLAAAFNEAERDGLIVTFNIGRNQYGRHAVQSISISKLL